MNCFLKIKEKNPKVSKTAKISNKYDIKSVLKPIKQSNIITTELETVEKRNIFNIKSDTIEHPKTASKLSNPIKQPNVITQQPNVVDHKLLLNIIKIYIFPQNIHKVMKLKSQILKDMMRSLTLRDLPLKMNYLKWQKKLKIFNFNKICEQNLLKMIKLLKTKCFQTYGFIQGKYLMI